MRLLDLEQGSPEWFAARCGIPTASSFSSIVTPGGKPSASADAYAAELIDELVRPMADRDQSEQAAQFSGNRHTERGHELEPKALAWFRFVTGLDARKAGFVLSDSGAMGCSPDSLIWVDDKPVSGCEIKAPEGKKHALWMMQNKLPDEHKAQVHGSMIVTGFKSWHFVSHCPGYKPFRLLVEWDDYTAKVAAALDGFTARLAVAREQFTEYLPQQKAA